jgi:WD40 repeat protein
MIPSHPTDSFRQVLLEEVLEEYMERLDRGEVVDREQLLARHPEVADALRSYFAGCDEVVQLGRSGDQKPPATPPPTDKHSGTRGPEETPSANGDTRWAGDYELLEKIGEGGMGVIFKARQLSLQRLVALKMIRPDRLSSAADVLRFRSEAEAAASLDHPNIVPIYEVGEHEGGHYFSMKLIEGGSLTRHLTRLVSDLRAAADLLAAVARAVHYAHQRGLLHRDLKPDNILLDAEGRPHVTDFGLAKRLELAPGEPRLTQQGMIVGTPSYMAPEQAAGLGRVTTAVDVYSLGSILYELLTGRPPFRAETPLGTLLQLQEQEPTPPRSLNRHAHPDLETICLKCLQKQPHRRYPSASALADDVERWLRGEPIQARPVGLRERVLKWARRRPGLAILAALLVVVFVGGLAGVSWQWRRAVAESRRAANHAEAERQTAYARAVALAYAEWRANNAGPAEQMLSACDQDLCGWEWHYLRRLFQVRQLAALHGHVDGVRAVVFSPDRARVASAGADGTVRVWEVVSGQEKFCLRGHDGPVEAVAFSADGRRLAGGGADGTVRVWDAVSGEKVASWQGHATGVTGLAFDPTGRRLASTGRAEPSHGELKLWDPIKGEILAGKTWEINILAAVAFSHDGQRVATAGHDGSVVVWNAATLEPMDSLKGQIKRNIRWTSVAFSADGRVAAGGRVATGSPVGLVQVWDTTARPKAAVAEPTAQEFFTPTQAAVSAVAFSGPDGRLIVAATADNTIQGWFTRSGMPAFTLRGHRRAVTSVAFSPDGKCLASGSLDRTVRLWDITRRDDDLTLRPANEGVTSIAFSPDGTRLASATRDRAVKVLEVSTGKTIARLVSLPDVVNGLAFDPDGGRLASAGNDGVVRLWEVSGGGERLRLGGHHGPVHAVAFSPEGGLLAAAGDDGVVRVWEVSGGGERFCLRGHEGPVFAVAFSPDGSRLASVGADGVARVWDAASGKTLLVLGDHGEPVYAVAFSSDGSSLASAGRDEIIRLWDPATGLLLRILHGHSGTVRGVAYGPGGRLASAGDDMVIRLWDGAGRELLALRGHTEAVRAVTFSRDGHSLASASDDRTIKVWDGTPVEGVSSPAE